MAASSGQSIEILVKKLDSSTVSTVKKALATVTKLTKRANFVGIFKEKGGLGKIIALLKMTNSSIVDMAMSALANCSMFEIGRREVRLLDGLVPIVSVLKNLNSSSILNRAARALANLAEDDMNAEVIEELGGLHELTKLLMDTSDTDCQESVIRALRIICTTPERKKIVFDLGGFRTMIGLLKSEKTALQNSCIRTVCEFTKNCTKEVAQQVQEFDGIKHIVGLASSSRPVVHNSAVLSLANLAVHAHVRVCIGSEGGIQHLYQQAKVKGLGHVTVKALEGLCYCCREAVNRNKVFATGGLEVLMQTLLSSEHHFLHRKIIAAFNCFYYNEQCLEFLLNAGIIPALVLHLRKIISHCSSAIYHSEDTEHDHYDHADFTSDFSSPTSSKNTLEFDTPRNISIDEAFLEEANNFAIQVRDSTESSRLSAFKRKPRSRSSSSTSPQSVKSIGSSPAVFSFCSMDSCTMTSSVSSNLPTITSVTTRPTALHSLPIGLICSSTPVKHAESSDSQTTDKLEMSSLDLSAIANSGRGMPQALPGENEFVPSTEECPEDIHQPDYSTELPTAAANSNTSSQTSPGIATVGDPVTVEVKSTPAKEKTASLSPSYTHKPSENATYTDTRGTSTTNTGTRNTSPHTPKAEGQGVPHHLHAPGHSTLMLLYRFSQMNDQNSILLLLTKPCLGVLLDYISTLSNPSPKCARLLSRLTREPQCFETLVTMCLSSDIHRQLVNGYTTGYFTTEENTPVLETSKKSKEGASRGDEACKDSSTSVHLDSRCKSIGQQLLENLSSQAQTPYGKGVLLHLMAKGTGDDWQGCVVSLPHLCRSKTLQQQLLMTRNGLKMLCCLLKDPPSERIYAAVVHSLVVLSSRIGLQLKIRPADEISTAQLPVSGDSTTIPSTTKDRKRKFDAVDDSLTPTSSEEGLHGVCKARKLDGADQSVNGTSLQRGTQCNYSNHQHGPFVVHFQVDSGETISADRQLLCDASDMFSAMLSSSYKEASQDVILLKDVTMTALTCVVHYAYGCGFPKSDYPSDLKCCDNVTMILGSFADLESKWMFLIELLAVADRYLLLGLKEQCVDTLLPLVSTSNAVDACVCGMHYHAVALCDYALKFLLLEVPCLENQYTMFKELLHSQEKSKILEQLYRLLLRQLEQNPV